MSTMYDVEFQATSKQVAAITSWVERMNKHDASLIFDFVKMIGKRAEEGVCNCHCRNGVNSQTKHSEWESHN